MEYACGLEARTSSLSEGRRRLMVRFGLPVTDGNVTATTGLEDWGITGTRGGWKI